MELLKKKILDEGTILPGNILKVDCFLNHRIDVSLFNEIGKEFKKRFSDVKVDKILTIESSGIGVAVIAAQYFDFVPVVFGKKTEPKTMDNDTYESNVYSFTKKKEYKIKVSKRFLNEGENILIIDDFLANGCAALGLIDMINMAGAKTVGCGIVIEKGFQPGRQELEKRGVKVESLAIIDRFEGNKIYFKD